MIVSSRQLVFFFLIWYRKKQNELYRKKTRKTVFFFAFFSPCCQLRQSPGCRPCVLPRKNSFVRARADTRVGRNFVVRNPVLGTRHETYATQSENSAQTGYVCFFNREKKLNYRIRRPVTAATKFIRTGCDATPLHPATSVFLKTVFSPLSARCFYFPNITRLSVPIVNQSRVNTDVTVVGYNWSTTGGGNSKYELGMSRIGTPIKSLRYFEIMCTLLIE